ncbi:MAG: class I SAM-dependent methyltransferase [Polyangiaceae bacterium]|nr:class I SAM-dependent methyltransferase [Polyangiaceae bacterium]MCB9606204.1 class I SAM-dependent methyltransferase [Polyangiaceae bacterium]
MSRFMAAIYDSFMQQTEEACLRAWREDLLQDLSGSVLEVGAGTGANLPLYPADLERLVLAEPDRDMSRKLRERLDTLGRNVEICEAAMEQLPFEAGSFDQVVCTLVLCSVPNPEASLAEVKRVLRPGGKLVFIEHVCDEKRLGRRLLQRGLEPLWKPLAGGCHLTRRTETTIRDAGFELSDVRRESMRKALPMVRASVRGIAVKPA